MALSRFLFVCLLTLGFYSHHSNAQTTLTTKCPNSYWTHQRERCYLVADYAHSFPKALSYCQKYGATLAEPRGFTNTHEVADIVHQGIPDAKNFRIGLQAPLSSAAAVATGGYTWSSDGQTTIDVGVWGSNQPDPSAGRCGYIEVSSKKWFLGSCDTLMPFVCELDPCPSGDRDTFMCNGKCIGTSLVCDWKDDCGNNMDEQNCANQNTYTLDGPSGTIEMASPYDNNRMHTWMIHTRPSTRIGIEFDRFSIGLDTVILFDGGLTIDSSRVSSIMSGDSGRDFISSYNFLILRFVAGDDSGQVSLGFKLNWNTTALARDFNILGGYTFANTDAQSGHVTVGTRQTINTCKNICTQNCHGFSYNKENKMCYFFNKRPHLMANGDYDLYVRASPPSANLKGLIPEFPKLLTATSSVDQIASPFYPFPYPSNYEVEYCIDTAGNNPITIEAVTVDLCCGDYVIFYDESHEEFDRLTSDSLSRIILSPGNRVYIRIVLENSGTCKGVLLEFTQGCSPTYTGTGWVTSPGYPGKNYRGLTFCTMTVRAPTPDTNLTLRFDDFDLSADDSLALTFDGTTRIGTGNSLQGETITTKFEVVMNFLTSSLNNGPGFSIFYSPGCPGFTDSYAAGGRDFNVDDSFTLSCAEGYFLAGTYQGEPSVEMTCLLGGVWDKEIPVCQRAFCGPAEDIGNGNVTASTGILGAEFATYACNPGYILENNLQITCMSTNQWQPRPICRSSRLCTEIGTSAPGTMGQILRNDGISHGSVVRLGCNNNNEEEILGAETVQCKQGQWDFVNDVASVCRDKLCPTPQIDNGHLSPDAAPSYRVGQQITVKCHEGYERKGPETVQCGDVDTNLPECIMKSCSLNGLDDKLVWSTADQRVAYGQSVSVRCEDKYELKDSTTTTTTISCISTGLDRTPVCVATKCQEPYQVKGSEYKYTNDATCWDVGCSFEFTCKSNYHLAGNSSKNNTIVECGEDRVWGFDTIRCEGGHCGDIKYPPSGLIHADSFQEGDLATFGCLKDGYTPWTPDTPDNTPNTEGITCIRNPETDELEWDGEVPTCNDTEPPEIVNCPTDQKIDLLAPTTYPEYYARDNNGIKSFTSNLKCLRTGQNFANGQLVSVTARDFADNEARCSFRILIPGWIDCKNEEATDLKIGSLSPGQNTITYDGYEFIRNIADAEISPNDMDVTITLNRNFLKQPLEINVTALDKDVAVDTCTLQFRASAIECASWVLDMPNTEYSYNSTSNMYELTCDSGYYFMEDPGADMISMSCADNEWNRDPPICATKSEAQDLVIFGALYQIYYIVNDGTDQECKDFYEAQIELGLSNFASDMSAECGGEFTVTLATYDVILSANEIQVLFTFNIYETNDDQAKRVECASTIQSILNSAAEIASIQDVGIGNSVCNPGMYDKNHASSVSFNYGCIGNRRFFLTEEGERICLECPVGYDYSDVVNNCLECARGTYRDNTQDDECQPCPHGGDPGLTGLSSVEACAIKAVCGPGYFSRDGLSPCTICPKHFYNPQNTARTCEECKSDEITVTSGSDSISDCLTQAEADDQGVDTPCTVNPCMNDGNCSICSHTYFCDCPTGYTGVLCDVEITPCSSNPCENDQDCTVSDDGESFICACNIGSTSATELTGTYCENDRYGCGANLCKHDYFCHNQKGSYSCKCSSHSGYTSRGLCDVPIDQCTVNACQNGGTCVAHGSFYRQCICPRGYKGFDCGTNTDDCNPDPCQNGATCVDGVDSFSCNCGDGYHGHHCQFRKACDVKCTDSITDNCHTCDMTGMAICTNIQNSYSCTCKEGYTGTSCEIAISVCNSYPCQHGGTCDALSDIAFKCVCAAPWTGDTCDTQINNCQHEMNEGVNCFSSPSGCICTCPLNFISDENEKCDIPYNACDVLKPCVEGSTCDLSETGTWSCICPDGYSGDSCETRDPDCSSDPCANGGTCAITDGQIACTCVTGYTGTYCEEDVIDCVPNVCAQNQYCVEGVNSYTCECANNQWGPNCDKDNYNRDMLIKPKTLCREEVSMMATFGDGETPITGLTIAFYERFEQVDQINGNEVILSLFGSNTPDPYIPENPDFVLIFKDTEVFSYVRDASRKRRKRAEMTMPYGVTGNIDNIADGRWHHIALSYNSSTGEIDLYVDGTFKTQRIYGNNFGSRWFLVPGAYDAVTGQTVPELSYVGRLANLLVVNGKLTDQQIVELYQRTSSSTFPNILDQRNLNNFFEVNYTSELVTSTCVPSDNNCQVLNAGVSVPTVVTCPGDTLVYTERGAAPTLIEEPTFSGNTGDIESNFKNSETTMDWGAHRLVYAAFDQVNSASVCAFDLYTYKEITCTVTADATNLPSFENILGGTRYQAQCPEGESIAGGVPRFQVCNMHSMWNGDIQYNFNYTYPVCSESRPLTAQTSLMLDLDVMNTDCTTVLTDYKANVLTKMKALNLVLGNELCPSGCFEPLNADGTYTCVSNELLRLNIGLGLLKPTMNYNDVEVTLEEAINIAVSELDKDVFTFQETSNQQTTTLVTPNVRSLAVSSPPACQEGYAVSGNLCVKCGAGTAFVASDAGNVCERCTKGSYSTDQTLAQQCVNCHDSRTTLGTGSTSSVFCLSKCRPGQFYDASSEECASCAVGYYQDSSEGEFSCKPCGKGLTTATTGAFELAACVSPASITTTTTQAPVGPVTGAATEGDSGLSAGVIIAIVLAILICLLLIIFFICFCCCRDMLPCFKKQKQIVAPSVKEGYYANKYGETNMQFVSYNLRDVREKKGRPLDKVPIVEHPLSDETGSVKTDISVHVPVFTEKMDGKVKKKSLYMSNGGNYMNSSRTRSLMSSREPTPRTYERPPLTSSPRDTHYDEIQEEPEYTRSQRSKRKRRKRKDRSGERSHRSADRSHRHSDHEERSHRSVDRSHRRSDYEERSYRSRSVEHTVNDYDEIRMAPMPKALAPMPHRIKSLPKAEAHLRPLSPLERPRPQVEPNEYREFIQGSPKRPSRRSNFMSYEDDEQPEPAIQRIEVESDLEDLR